ncbi:DEAD/DEAH box helicase [Ruminococcaceae bacterium OttesenSCG-928-O06]|nr:DEAD/DEAH box helicase [Ruminococcaceae bacterium OttesenSCG-928-O06]
MLFQDIDLPKEIQDAVQRMGFTEMTEVQEKALPPMMEGKDVIAKAPTGTGKTCAFGIPLLVGLNAESDTTQALVLAPTRELAQQITGDLRELAHFLPNVRIACVYGGQDIKKQFDQLKKGPQIIVATPGRLLDHMQRRTVQLGGVVRVVLDEADEMLDMGFYKDVRKILDSLKNKKQLGMFSATISREVMDIGWLYQRDAVEITVQPVEDSQPRITQYSILTTGRNKLADLAAIIVNGGYERVMVFCNTKYTTGMLSNQLARLNFDVDCLHGDLSQAERNKIMGRFKEGQLPVLVSTDVAARGIDVDDVDAVVNYDVPPSNEYYTHRIGRTGRAKKEGVAYILYMPDEEKRLRELVRLTRNTVQPMHFNEERQLVPGKTAETEED